MINESVFKRTLPTVNWNIVQPYMVLLNEICREFDIDTPMRKAHFLAQITYESGGFKYLAENFNYSSQRLQIVFRRYFPTLESTVSYMRRPEKIANRVYANRLGNGNESSGDGWKFRGRGLIQIRGKFNYQTFSDAMNDDFVSHPALLELPKWAVIYACWFWKENDINKYADKDDIRLVTKCINGDLNGIGGRQVCLLQYKELFFNTDSLLLYESF